ncbi:MAG: sugar ABC transporter permease [Chloroflexi bacterium]|nr:sugar ABC transporter permease [Chloroflexota bacterium]
MSYSVTKQKVSYQQGAAGRLRTAVVATAQRAYKARTAYFFLAPAFLLMITFIAYPLVQSLILSLYEWNGITPPRFVGLTNFKLLFQDGSLWVALYNTIAFSVLTTAGTVSIGFLLAVAVERRVKGWAFFKVIYFLPVMISITVVGLLWGQLYDPTFGPVNLLLKAGGIAHPPVWMGDPNVALYAIIAVTIWQYSGFPMIVFLAAMENIPPDLHDAATIDGVNGWQRIVHLIFPMVKQVFAVIVMLQIIFSLKVFDIVWVMTQGGPGESTTVLGVYLYRNAFIYTYFGYGSTVAVLMTAIVFTLSVVYQRFVRPERIEY